MAVKLVREADRFGMRVRRQPSTSRGWRSIRTFATLSAVRHEQGHSTLQIELDLWGSGRAKSDL